MGIAITATTGDALPRPIDVVLTCDNRATLFHKEFHYRGASFIAAHSDAMSCGWKETFDDKGERIWLCPECSNK